MPLTQKQAQITDDGDRRIGVGGISKGASTWVADDNYTLDALDLLLRKENGPVSNVFVDIHDATPGLPGTLLSTSAAIAANTLPNANAAEAPAWIRFLFAAPANCVLGTKYRFALRGDGAGDGFGVAGEQVRMERNVAVVGTDVEYFETGVGWGVWIAGTQFDFKTFTLASAAPTPGFTTVIDRKRVAVTNTSVAGANPITSIEYAYGDGSARTALLTHVYAIGGTYTITQYVNDGVAAEQSTTHNVTTTTRYRARLKRVHGRSVTDTFDRPDA